MEKPEIEFNCFTDESALKIYEGRFPRIEIFTEGKFRGVYLANKLSGFCCSWDEEEDAKLSLFFWFGTVASLTFKEEEKGKTEEVIEALIYFARTRPVETVQEMSYSERFGD